MNEANYRMDFDERRQYVYDKAYEILEGDTDAFVDACEELDNWNGFLGDTRCYDMDEIDEFFSRPSELLDKMDDFQYSDEYFYFTGYSNVSTTDDKYDHYSDDFSVDDVLDALIENYSHVDIYNNDTLDNLLAVLANEDFGIEEDWAYDEDMDEDDEPEETDEEFTERIDEI